MTILNVKATADPVYEIVELLSSLGPWAEVNDSGKRTLHKELPTSLFSDAKLIFIHGVTQYKRLFRGLMESNTQWCVVIRCSDKEAGYNNLPYTNGLSIRHILDLVTYGFDVVLETKAEVTKELHTVLPAVITELYKIPRPVRPFKEVFSVICGATSTVPKSWPPTLAKVVAEASRWIAPVIQAAKDPQNRDEIRAAAALHQLDPFEINFAYAKYVQDYSKSPARGRPTNEELERRRLVREKEAKAKERAAQRAMPHKFHRPEAEQERKATQDAKKEVVKSSPTKSKKGDTGKRRGLFALTG